MVYQGTQLLYLHSVDRLDTVNAKVAEHSFVGGKR